MPSADDFKINLNQNIWGLLLAFGALGAADYFKLSNWFWWLAFVAAILMLASVAVTTIFYTLNYAAGKCRSMKREKDNG